MNRYVYCRNNPLKYVDPTGCSVGSSISDTIKAMGGALNQAQKDAQRAFWKMGADLYLRKQKGFLTSAWMLEYACQDNPNAIWRGTDSRIANLINNDPAYLSALDAKIRLSTNGKIDGFLENVQFNTGDLYYSIHKSTVYVNGYRQSDGKWIIYARLTDTYDFTEVQTFMNDDKGWSTKVGLGTVANDIAVVSQRLGAIKPYDITVEFYTTR